jgi:hypothetical protein
VLFDVGCQDFPRKIIDPSEKISIPMELLQNEERVNPVWTFRRFLNALGRLNFYVFELNGNFLKYIKIALR